MIFLYSLFLLIGFGTTLSFSAADVEIPTHDGSLVDPHPGYSLRERKETLKETFRHLCDFKEQGDLKEEPVFYDFSSDISDSYASWIQECLQKFTQKYPLPEGLHINVFTLGSFTSRNVTFESDFEFGIMVNHYTPEAIPYCLGLIHNLHAQIVTEDVGKTLSFDEELTPPLTGKEGGSPFLIATPEIMALYPWSLTERHRGYEGSFWSFFNTQLWTSSEHNRELFDNLCKFYSGSQPTAIIQHIQNLARAMKSTEALFGNREIFSCFQKFRAHQLTQAFQIHYEDTQRPSILKTLKEEFDQSLFFFYEKFLNKTSFYMKAFAEISSLHIKRDVFRLVEQTVINMGFIGGILSGEVELIQKKIQELAPKRKKKEIAALQKQLNNLAPETDLLKIVNTLTSRGVLVPPLAKEIAEYLDFSLYLRLKEQMSPHYAHQDIRLVDTESVDVSIRAEEAALAVHEDALTRLKAIEERTEGVSHQILVGKGNIGSIKARISRLKLAKDNPAATIFSLDEIGQIERLQPRLRDIVSWFLSQQAYR